MDSIATFAHHVVSTTFSDLPDTAVSAAKTCISDTLGVGLSGSSGPLARELSDALKRRCLYHWVHYPDAEKEQQIVQKHLPDIDQKLAVRLVKVVNQLRQRKLDKSPGIAETLDWAQGLLALGFEDLTAESLETSLGCVLKSADDIQRIRQEGLDALLAEVNS